MSPDVQPLSNSQRSGRLSTPGTGTAEEVASGRRYAIGFLGPTSFSAVFSKGENHHGGTEAATGRSVRDAYPVTTDKIHEGAKLLVLLLKNLSIYPKAGRRLNLLWDGGIISRPLFRLWYEEIARYTEHLNSPAADTLYECRDLSKTVWQNSRQRVDVNERMQMREWAKLFTGPDLTWEVIGIVSIVLETSSFSLMMSQVFAVMGLTALDTSDWDAMHSLNPDKDTDRSAFVDQMRTALDTCLSFCAECEVMNEVYLMLLIQDGCFLEYLKGDTSTY